MLPVTIIIPAYIDRPEKLLWLGECLESACSQDCEVIVYDDCSPISIGHICESHDGIRLLRGSIRGGVSIARNGACDNSTTEFIFPLDSDDTIAPQAIRKLSAAWTGKPVYPDISKFGDEVEPHYVLLDFVCDHLLNHVGFTSVNVLHTKEQWKSIGGWNPQIDFYEDGEYNARLMGTYCGQRFPEPLVNYRQHPYQRTREYSKRAWKYGQMLLEQIRSYDMACPGCGKRRSQSNAPANRMMSNNPGAGQQPVAQVVVGPQQVNLPTEFEGRILVQYLGGKGSARHTKRGPVSNKPYQVTYGDLLYVDPRDVSEGHESGRPFVRVQGKPTPQPVVEEVKPHILSNPPRPPAPAQTSTYPQVTDVPKPFPEPKELTLERRPTRSVKRDPVAPPSKDLPDISNMDYAAVQLLEITAIQAKDLLKLEKANKNRPMVKRWLNNRIKNDA